MHHPKKEEPINKLQLKPRWQIKRGHIYFTYLADD